MKFFTYVPLFLYLTCLSPFQIAARSSFSSFVNTLSLFLLTKNVNIHFKRFSFLAPRGKKAQ